MSAVLAFSEETTDISLLSDRELLRQLFRHLSGDDDSARAASANVLLRTGGLPAAVRSRNPPTSFAPPLPTAFAAMLTLIGRAAELLQEAASMTDMSDDNTTRLRRAGAWLRTCRDRAGLSQLELAARLQIPSYTLVDQLESGAGRLRWDEVPSWAAALALPAPELASGLMRFYEPSLHALLCKSKPAAE